jgi:hypothetical protein
MLAVRYRWAQLALRAVIEHGVRLQRRLVKAGPGVRLASSAVTVVTIALLAAVILR